MPRTRTPAAVISQQSLDILEFVRSTTADQGYPPSLAEIGHHFGIRSSSSVRHRLTRLAQVGLVSTRPGLARTVVVADADEVTRRIAAGELLVAVTGGAPTAP